VVALFGGVMWWLAITGISKESTGYIVVDQVTVRTGDAESFSTLVEWSEADGRAVEIAQSRGDWVLIRTPSATGWVPADTIESADATSSFHQLPTSLGRLGMLTGTVLFPFE